MLFNLIGLSRLSISGDHDGSFNQMQSCEYRVIHHDGSIHTILAKIMTSFEEDILDSSAATSSVTLALGPLSASDSYSSTSSLVAALPALHAADGRLRKLVPKRQYGSHMDITWGFSFC